MVILVIPDELNAFCPIVRRELGRTILASEEQREKALAPIPVRELGRLTL